MESIYEPPAGVIAPPDGDALTPEQISVLIILERTGAGFSMVAIALTVFTFILFRKMRTTPNVFLLCASGANAGACCASMMGYDGMHAGLESGLCQAQAFIFQWFVPLRSKATLAPFKTDLGAGSCNRIHGGPSPWLSMSTSCFSSTPTRPPFAGTYGFTACSASGDQPSLPSLSSASGVIHEARSLVMQS